MFAFQRSWLPVAAGVFAVVGVCALAQAQSPASDSGTLVIANSQWLDALRGDNLWKAVLKFNAVAPNVKLTQEAVPSATINDKLMTEVGAGQGPDVAMIQDDLFFALADAGFLVPLDKAVAGNHNLNKTNDAGVVGGKRLGLAWQRAVYAMIYNKLLTDAAGVAAPTNIDELIAAAKAVTAKTGAVGFTARHQITDFAGWFKDYQNWAYGYGVSWVDGKGKVTVDTPESVATVIAFKKVYDAGIIPIGDDMTTQRSRFKANKAGFSIDNSGSTLNLVSGGALASKDLVAAPLPFKNPGVHQQIFVVVNSHSKNQQAALDLVSWLASPDGQQALRDASGPDTLATDVPISAAYKAANPWAQTFADLGQHSRSVLIPGYEVRTADIMRPVMEAVESVIAGKSDPKSAMATAQKQVDSKL